MNLLDFRGLACSGPGSDEKEEMKEAAVDRLGGGGGESVGMKTRLGLTLRGTSLTKL